MRMAVFSGHDSREGAVMRVRMSGVFPWMAVTGIAALSLNGVAAGQAVRFNKARATTPYTAE
jgi:hypothetical protein